MHFFLYADRQRFESISFYRLSRVNDSTWKVISQDDHHQHNVRSLSIHMESCTLPRGKACRNDFLPCFLKFVVWRSFFNVFPTIQSDQLLPCGINFHVESKVKINISQHAVIQSESFFHANHGRIFCSLCARYILKCADYELSGDHCTGLHLQENAAVFFTTVTPENDRKRQVQLWQVDIKQGRHRDRASSDLSHTNNCNLSDRVLSWRCATLQLHTCKTVKPWALPKHNLQSVVFKCATKEPPRFLETTGPCELSRLHSDWGSWGSVPQMYSHRHI